MDRVRFVLIVLMSCIWGCFSLNILSPFAFNLLVAPIKLPILINGPFTGLLALKALLVTKLALVIAYQKSVHVVHPIDHYHQNRHKVPDIHVPYKTAPAKGLHLKIRLEVPKVVQPLYEKGHKGPKPPRVVYHHGHSLDPTLLSLKPETVIAAGAKVKPGHYTSVEHLGGGMFPTGSHPVPVVLPPARPPLLPPPPPHLLPPPVADQNHVLPEDLHLPSHLVHQEASHGPLAPVPGKINLGDRVIDNIFSSIGSFTPFGSVLKTNKFRKKKKKKPPSDAVFYPEKAPHPLTALPPDKLLRPLPPIQHVPPSKISAAKPAHLIPALNGKRGTHPHRPPYLHRGFKIKPPYLKPDNPFEIPTTPIPVPLRPPHLQAHLTPHLIHPVEIPIESNAPHPDVPDQYALGSGLVRHRVPPAVVPPPENFQRGPRPNAVHLPKDYHRLKAPRPPVPPPRFQPAPPTSQAHLLNGNQRVIPNTRNLPIPVQNVGNQIKTKETAPQITHQVDKVLPAKVGSFSSGSRFPLIKNGSKVKLNITATSTSNQGSPDLKTNPAQSATTQTIASQIPVASDVKPPQQEKQLTITSTPKNSSINVDSVFPNISAPEHLADSDPHYRNSTDFGYYYKQNIKSSSPIYNYYGHRLRNVSYANHHSNPYYQHYNYNGHRLRNTTFRPDANYPRPYTQQNQDQAPTHAQSSVNYNSYQPGYYSPNTTTGSSAAHPYVQQDQKYGSSEAHFKMNNNPYQPGHYPQGESLPPAADYSKPYGNYSYPPTSSQSQLSPIYTAPAPTQRPPNDWSFTINFGKGNSKLDPFDFSSFTNLLGIPGSSGGGGSFGFGRRNDRERRSTDRAEQKDVRGLVTELVQYLDTVLFRKDSPSCLLRMICEVDKRLSFLNGGSTQALHFSLNQGYGVKEPGSGTVNGVPKFNSTEACRRHQHRPFSFLFTRCHHVNVFEVLSNMMRIIFANWT